MNFIWVYVVWYGEYDAPIFKDGECNGEELFTHQYTDDVYR